MTLTTPPVLIALPHGMNVSGVTLWATRLANALVGDGHPVTLLTHSEPTHQRRLDIPLDARIVRVHIDTATPLEGCNGDLTPYLPHYARALTDLALRSVLPVVYLPNLAGDDYGIGAALSMIFQDRLRTIGWMHNDTKYDATVLHHYEALLHRFVPVSCHIERALRDRIPTRAEDIVRIPYAVEIPSSLPEREPLEGRSIRILYTGRIDHYQKRISIIPEISHALDSMGVAHTLTMLGDGPASGEIDARCEELPHCFRLDATSPDAVRALLASHDCLVLASRFEGLSISMLEALAHGCAPIVANVESGASEAIAHNSNGMLIDTGEDDPAAIAGLFAEHIAQLAQNPRRLRDMQETAWTHAREHYTISRHVRSVREVLHEVAHEPTRVWPTDRPCAFTSDASILGDATVPSDAPRRMRDTLRRIAQNSPHARVALWGGGRHTISLATEFAMPPVPVVAIVDDDESRHGETLWGLPILGAESLRSCGITDCVISSWMHQQTMWDRREQIESVGVRVHRIYPSVDGAALKQRPVGIA
ncbi:MAG: glycosyltransferase [Phycisphaerales bacterium JB043]